jgi:sugar fermentation stimulation protein A
MKFTKPLKKGLFLKRYKRFFADIETQEGVVVAHVANTGSLKSVLLTGAECLLSESDNPERKLKFSLEALSDGQGGWVGVNTSLPNQLGQEAFDQKRVAHWQSYDEIKPEFKINAETRLDLRLRNSKTDQLHFVEIKNVTMKEGDCALFPDAVTERGQKHLRELTQLTKQGYSTEILFIIQRTDCKKFAAAKDIDPEYARLLEEACSAGVRVTAVTAVVTENGVEWGSEMAFLRCEHLGPRVSVKS